MVATLTVLTSVQGQSGTTQGTRGRTDPVQRELQRRFESEAIERALAASPHRRDEHERRLILTEIREDFLGIQIVNDDLQKLGSQTGDLNSKLIAKSAAEITKRAERLNYNLALPKGERTTHLPRGTAETGIEQLRLSLSLLSNSINGFVENPIFEKARVIDVNLSAKARRDLDQIIEVSKQVKKISDKLKRASPQAPFVSSEPPAVPAFPGAEGFGSTTPGGRGGRVIFITNLDDDGPGSFRAACEAEGPRIVIFRISGLITLGKPIVIKNPYVTIAGQSAPGGGICLRNYTFIIATHDVVVRYLRSRLGDLSAQEADSITIASGAQNVILDHCSATWSIDEMPDSWERSHGLNPHDPTDAATDSDKDGYTNLEEYLNSIEVKRI